nr:hypothetical protein [Uruburuella suis]
MFINDFHNRISKPALIRFAVDGHRRISQACARFFQNLLVAGCINLIAGKARSAPNDKIIHIIVSTEVNRALKSMPFQCRRAGDTVIPKHLQHSRVHFCRFLVALFYLSID